MGDANQPSRLNAATEPSANADGDSGLTERVPPTDTFALGSASSFQTPVRRISRTLIRSLIAVIAGSLILRLASQTMGQMTQSYLDHLDRYSYQISHTTRGYVLAAFFITELLGSLVFGAMSDRYGRKVFIILGPALGVIAAQITAMTSVLWLLVLARLLAGLSTGSSVPATLGYISEATVDSPNLRARVVGLFEVTLVGGIAIGAVVGGYLWEFFGSARTVAGVELTSPAFSINALIYVLSIGVFVWGLKDIRRSHNAGPERGALASSHLEATRGKLEHYRTILKSPTVLMFGPAWVSIFAIIGVWTNHALGLLTGSRHFDGQLLTASITAKKFGIGFGTLAVFFALGVLAWSFILARYRKTSVMLVSTFALFALLLTVLGLNHLGSFSSAFYYLLLGALLIEVLVLSGFTPAALTYLADVTENFKADRGSIMGLYSVFLGLGQLLGTSAGGYFADWNGVDGLLTLSAILGGVTALSLLALRRHETVTATQLKLSTER